MKKNIKTIIFITMLLGFLVGCNQKIDNVDDLNKDKTNKDKINEKDIYITDSYTSCIDPRENQYTRNTVFDDNNCESVIVFMTRIVNATDKTTVKMVWIYNNKTILEKITTENLSINQYPSSSYVEPENGYLKGKYTIKVYIDNIYNTSFEFTKN